jgi:hypothetical protein
VNFTVYNGYPQARIKFIQKFTTGNGFNMLAGYLKTNSDVWIGSEMCTILLNSIFEISSSSIIDQSIIDDIVNYITILILKLTEDQIKKEKDNMNNLIHTIRLLYSIDTPSRTKIENELLFYNFWLDYTLKMLNCSSFILKLLGWDELHEMIRLAYQTKPFALNFMVDGAGMIVIFFLFLCNFFVNIN